MLYIEVLYTDKYKTKRVLCNDVSSMTLRTSKYAYFELTLSHIVLTTPLQCLASPGGTNENGYCLIGL